MEKKKRFEVFKKDDFTCQYCGIKPPDTILEVDHIIPRSLGGSNEIINLTTSCFSCNRGKSNGLIENKQTRQDIEETNKELSEQVKRMKKYYKLLTEMRNIKGQQIAIITKHWYDNASSYLSDKQESSLRLFLEKHSVEDVEIAINIACKRVDGWRNRFQYMCGVLHNWEKYGKTVY